MNQAPGSSHDVGVDSPEGYQCEYNVCGMLQLRQTIFPVSWFEIRKVEVRGCP